MNLKMFKKTTPTILAVASGKGGVGKSTVAVNLALAFKQRGLKVGLMDTDLYGPSVRRMLPEDQMPSQKGEIIIPALCDGIRMISMAYFRKEHEAAIIRAPIANGIVTQFLNQVDWGPLDILVIDFPPGTGDIQLTLSQKARLSGAILVTTPQEVAVMDVRRSAHMFHQVQVPIIGIVENMSYYGKEKISFFGKGGGERLAAEIGAPLLQTLPLDPQLSQRADEGRSPFDTPETILAPLFLELAAKIQNHLTSGVVTKPLFQKVFLSDPRTLKIEWSDGTSKTYPLIQLQRLCPCAACAETPPQVAHDVEVLEVVQVGRYALKIKFSSGCSNGIFTFDQLQQITEVPA